MKIDERKEAFRRVRRYLLSLVIFAHQVFDQNGEVINRFTVLTKGGDTHELYFQPYGTHFSKPILTVELGEDSLTFVGSFGGFSCDFSAEALKAAMEVVRDSVAQKVFSQLVLTEL